MYAYDLEIDRTFQRLIRSPRGSEIASSSHRSSGDYDFDSDIANLDSDLANFDIDFGPNKPHDSKHSNPKQQKWLTKLMGYQYEIHYKLDQENMVVDALSHLDNTFRDAILTTLSLPTFSMFAMLKDFYSCKPVRQQLVFIPIAFGLIPFLLTKIHFSPVGGNLELRPLSLIFLLPSLGLTCILMLNTTFTND
ncbi:hypothetical protein CR513_45347, partial [Mucuna pruriens]